jgi:hypothetical protein
MDSIGNPGIGPGGADVVAVVVLMVLVVVVLVAVLTVVDEVEVEVEVTTTVDVEVVVARMTSGPYFRIRPWSLTIHPSSGATMNTDRRATDIVGGRGCVETTSHVKPSQ